MHSPKLSRSATALLAMTAFAGGSAFAEGTTTLTSLDGELELIGTVQDFVGDSYVIDTNVGVFEIPASEVACEGIGCRVQQTVKSWHPGPAGANVEVALADGSLLLEGKITAMTGGLVTVASAMGEFQLPLDRINCIGAGCPTIVEKAVFVEADSLIAKALQQGNGVVNTALDASSRPTEFLSNATDFTSSFALSGSSDLINNILPVSLKTYAEAFGGRLGLVEYQVALADGGSDQLPVGIGYRISADNGSQILDISGQTAANNADRLALLASRDADIAFTHGTASRRSVSQVANSGGGDINRLDQQRIIAIEGLVAVVSPSNPIKSVSIEDLRGVLTGELTSWAQLGGLDVPISVHGFMEGTEGHELAEYLLLNPAGLTASNTLTPHRQARQLINAVMNDPAAIGFVSYKDRGQATPLSLNSACRLDIPANEMTIKTEQYPLTRRLMAYNHQDATTPEVMDFLAYLDSPELDQGIRNAGLVDLGVSTSSMSDAINQVSTRAENYDIPVVIDGAERLLRIMDGQERLSTVFRFAKASTRLDGRSERDLQRMVDFIAAHTDASYTVVGFTDGVGTFNENEDLGARRAKIVLDALRQSDAENQIVATSIEAVGVGELYSLACNETPDERAINRRVEIWMRR